MAPPPVAAVLTLGCKLNTAESDEIARGLAAAGYQVVDRFCEADAYVINTCSVTHVADRKSRQLIRAARRMSPRAAVTVTGCFPQSAGADAVLALGADLTAEASPAGRERLLAFLSSIPAGQTVAAPPPALRTRAFIRAQAGCNDVCAFCVVPRTRGREASRPASEVVAEINRAAGTGVREVVVTGTQLGAWGRDFDLPLQPHHLLAAILAGTDVPRVRFSSLQPQDITAEMLGLWTDPRLMPHFHLALQSGSDVVLQRMRRRYSSADYLRAVERIYAAIPGAAITTDVIAGFPGETEAEFAATEELCVEAGFARIHCFLYSAREKTAAARLSAQVPAPIRRERMRRLLDLSDRLSRQYRARCEGQTRPVLWESPVGAAGGEIWHGYSDNYISVYAHAKDLRHRVTPVRIGALYDDGTWGYLPRGVT